MNTRTDKIMHYAAYIYIILPFLIFAIGWMRWYYALTISIIMVTSFILSLKNLKNFISIDLKKNKNKIIIALTAILLWVFFSGIGGYSYQNEDQHYRNAILRDLITFDWPVVYHVDGLKNENIINGQSCLMVYYLGYWLPAALIGKVFGWVAANFFIYIWTVSGIILIYYFFCRKFKKFSLKLLWLFIFFGNLYYIGCFFYYPFRSVLEKDYVLWADGLTISSSTTGTLYWVFNQFVPPVLIILLILNNIHKKNILFIYTFCFFFGPLSFIGLFPYILYIIIQDIFFNADNKNNLLNKIISYISFQNVIGGLLIVSITLIYFSSNSAVNHIGIFHPKSIESYLEFTLLSYLLLYAFLFKKYKKEPLFYISFLIITFLPFLEINKPYNDFSARGSIPSMIILMYLTGKMIIENNGRNRKLYLVSTYLILAAIGTGLQLSRSILFTTGNYFFHDKASIYLYGRNNIFGLRENLGKNPNASKNRNNLIQDDLKTLNNPNNFAINNFMGLTSKSIFYKYLAK